jgi:hypothetical protein
MMEKLAQAGEGGGRRQPLFTIFTITDKVVVYATAKSADTLLLFLLYPYMYSVTKMFNSAFIIRRIRSHLSYPSLKYFSIVYENVIGETVLLQTVALRNVNVT